jgi:hypothetical protein
MKRYHGDLRQRREAAEHDPAPERKLLMGCKDVGEVGGDIFLREVQTTSAEASIIRRILLRWSRPANLILRHRKAKQKMNSTPSSSRNKPSSASLERYIRAAHYLAGAQIYLRENALLREPSRARMLKG